MSDRPWNTQPNSFWTDERVALLDHLWNKEGLSASQCAKKLGCTRNAAIGKCHRKGWKRDQTVTHDNRIKGNAGRWLGSTRKPPAKPKAVKGFAFGDGGSREIKPPKPIILAPVLLTGQERPWLERENGECKFLVTEGADGLACCAPVDRLGYCAFHVALCYVPGTGLRPRDRKHLIWLAA